MFRYICLFTVLLLIPFFVSAGECEVKITADIPAFAEKFDLSISVNRKNYPVSRKSPSICVTKKELDVYPLKYTHSSVGLMIGHNGKKGSLFQSRVHLQKSEIFINHKTSIASLICPYYCGFYEYQRLISDPDVIKIAESFLKDISNQPGVLLDREKVNKFYAPYLNQTKTIYDTYLKAGASLPEIPVHKGRYSVSYSSGFWTYWSTYLKKSSYFDRVARVAIKKLPKDDQFESVYPVYRKDLIKVISPAGGWDNKKKIIHSVAKKLAENKNPTLKEISKLLIATRDETENRVNNIINNSEVKFDVLSNRRLSSSDVIAHWLRFSYHYATDIEKFQSLFSKRLKKQIIHTIEKDNALDRSLSRVIARYGRLLMAFNKKNDARVFTRLLYEYQDVGEVTNERIIVEDKLEKISLVFENGAWRLDDFTIDYF